MKAANLLTCFVLVALGCASCQVSRPLPQACTLVGDAVAAVPDEWLAADVEVWGDQYAVRAAYGQFLMARIAARGEWVPALVEAVAAGPTRDALGHRVSARQSSGPPEWIPELTIGREGS